MKNKEGEKATGQKPLTMGPAVAPRSARGACSLDTLKIFFDPFFFPSNSTTARGVRHALLVVILKLLTLADFDHDPCFQAWFGRGLSCSNCLACFF